MARNNAQAPKRKYRSISISIPAELEDHINRAAAAAGMNRSQWLCWLATQHLLKTSEEKPPLPKIPSRIKR